MSEMSPYRDMLSVFVVIFLLDVSRSAPTGCEELVHPLDKPTPHLFAGRWSLVAGSLHNKPSMEALRQTNRIIMYFSNSSETSALSHDQINRFSDQCQYLSYNISVEGSRFTFDVGNRFNRAGTFLRTSCPDCMVMQWIVNASRRNSVDLYLLSRRTQVEPEEIEEFRAQLECLQLPEPIVMDPSEEICPELHESQTIASASISSSD